MNVSLSAPDSPVTTLEAQVPTLSTSWTMVSILVLLAVLCRLTFPKSHHTSQMSTRGTLWRASLCGLGMALVMGFYLADPHLFRGIYTGSDFTQYCEATDAVRAGRPWSINPHRSRVAALLPGIFAGNLGIMDGLSLGALLSTAVLLGGIYLWAWALHGRTAAVAAVLLSGAFAPLVLLTRTLSFYPQACAGYVLAGATSTLALRYRTRPLLLLGSLTPGLAILLNPQGVAWALPALGVTLLAAVLPQPSPGKKPDERQVQRWRKTGANLLLVVLALSLTWWAGRFVYSGNHQGSLESEVYHYVETLHQQAQASGLEVNALEPCSSTIHEGFIWGEDAPWQLVPALRCMGKLRAQLPSELSQVPQVQLIFNQQMKVWQPLLVLGLLATVFGLRRRPVALLGLIPNLLPYGLALYYTPLDPSLRRMAVGLAAFPVVLGIAFAILLEDGPDPRWPRGRRKKLSRLPRTWPAWIGLGLLVTGLLPTPLSPRASWRAPFTGGLDLAQVLSQEAPRSLSQVGCKSALESDMAKGIPLHGWLGDIYSTNSPSPAGR